MKQTKIHSTSILYAFENLLPYAIIDPDGVMLKANTLMEKTTGLKMSQLEGARVDDLLDLPFSQLSQYVAQKLEQGQPWKQTLATKSQNGELYKTSFRMIPLKDGDGQFSTLAAVLIRTKPQKELVTEEAELIKAVNQNLLEGIFRTNLQGNLIYANEAFKRLFGLDDAALKAFNYKDLYVDPMKQLEIQKQLDQSNSVSGKEVLMRKLDGATFWAALSVTKSVGENSEFIFDGVLRDISSVRELQKRLHAEKRKAEEANEAKQQFLSTMSHELRTPMNAVIGLTHLILQDNPKPSQEENLNTLQFSAQSLLHIINDILDYSKIEAGKIEFERTPFDVQNVVKNVHASFALKADAKDLKLDLILEGKIPELLRGDSLRLGQILNNLISNAIKFTYHGVVKILLEAKKLSEKKFELHFSIKDSGIGIPQDKIESIFNQFTQASASTTRKFGGTGLGLAITKRLIELQEGKLSVKSMPGHGSNFSFYIPYTVPDSIVAQVGAKGASALDKSIAGVRILLAEDNEVNQIVLKKFAQLWDAKIDIATNGFEAIEMVKKRPYDILLMDLQMPLLDGYDAAKEIIRDQEGSGRVVPIIAVTATSIKEIRKNIEEIGMVDYVTKPFVPDELFDKIYYWVHEGKK